MTLTIVERRAICRAAAATGRICQTGTQQRSSREFIGDDEANAMRARPMRAPWTLSSPAIH